MPERIGWPENLSLDDQVRIVGTNIDDGEVIEYLGLEPTGEKVKAHIEMGSIIGVLGVIKQVIIAIDKIIPK